MVTARARVPASSVNSAGKKDGPVVGIRVTSSQTTVMTPTIITTISTITSARSTLSDSGNTPESAAMEPSLPTPPAFTDILPPLSDDDAPFGPVLHLTIGAEAPPRLDKALAALVPAEAALSRTRLMRMIEEGDVLRDGQPVRDPKSKVAAGEVYALRLAPPVDMETLPEAIALSVVWEDGDLIVIDKPADGIKEFQ